MIEILEVQEVNDALAEMAALFRVELHSYKGIVSKPDIEAGCLDTISLFRAEIERKKTKPHDILKTVRRLFYGMG